MFKIMDICSLLIYDMDIYNTVIYYDICIGYMKNMDGKSELDEGVGSMN